MIHLRAPVFRVEINGTDYTARFNPRVTSIDVTDKDGLTSDTCSIKLADVDGTIALPGEGDRLTVYLGQEDAGVGMVFDGFVDEVTSSGTKGGGRELTIGAKGVDTRSKAKEPTHKHKDDASFGDVAKEWGKAAGLSDVVVSDALASIQDDYWAMQGESFISWAQRTARDLGATFKIQGGRGIFVETNGGQTVSGKDLPEIAVTWGVNLERWDISPVVTRPRHKKTRARYYDQKEAKWKYVEVETGDDVSEATHTNRFSEKSEASAKRKAGSLKKRSNRSSGEGQVVIVGTADAKPEAICVVSGLRPGIDGRYRISGVQHRLTKSNGYVVTLDLKQPQGEAGKDSRRKTSAGAPASAGSDQEAGAVPVASVA